MVDVFVHLNPAMVTPSRFARAVVVVTDVLRATTTMLHALAAGCAYIRPCATVEEARAVAATYPQGTALLAGEREGLPLPGFDLGNSPLEMTPERCAGKVLVMTTSNGTRALLHATSADVVLPAAYVNETLVAERLAREDRPIHILCAGEGEEIALEDLHFAGALVQDLVARRGVRLSDAAALAREYYRSEMRTEVALTRGRGAERLQAIGTGADIAAAARRGTVPLLAEMRQEPVRVEVVA